MFFFILGGGGGGGGQGDGKTEPGTGFFWLLRTISYFTYEMVNNQSEAAMDGGLRKHRHGCRCFRLVRFHNITHFISKIWLEAPVKKSRPRLRLSVPLPRPVRPPTNLSKLISHKRIWYNKKAIILFVQGGAYGQDYFSYWCQFRLFELERSGGAFQGGKYGS